MPVATPTPPVEPGPADITLRIATGLVELAPDHIVSTALGRSQEPPAAYLQSCLPTKRLPSNRWSIYPSCTDAWSPNNHAPA
jgi:hypothetical protein